MKIGCCAPLRMAEELQDFDYLEIPCEDLPKAKYATKAYRLLRPNPTIYEDIDGAKRTLTNIVQLARNKGVEIITFGSGSSRKTANDVASIEELQIWKRLLQHADKEAGGMKIALEPLTQRETNFINSVEESAKWILDLELENFGITLDSFHFRQEGRNLDELVPYKDLIIHSHISGENQNEPESMSGYLSEFVQLVKEISCDMSLEMVPYSRPSKRFLDELRSLI